MADKTIIVKLQGGLGNQMFQYAAGKSLAVKNNAPLLVDLSFLEANNESSEEFTARPFELAIFNHISYEKAPVEQVRKIFNKSLIKRIQKKLFNSGVLVYDERSAAYDSHFQDIVPPVYLSGYWQSEKYFQNITSIIRSDFAFSKYEVTPENMSTVDEIKNATSVSIHVRRGDYVSSSSANERHGICPLTYYRQAMEIMTEQFKDVTFYVFSDDTEWAKKNIQHQKQQCYIVETGQKSWVDMYIMSQCKHHIIANSSFSWWGAWLNPDPEKIVIAPKNWFKILPEGFTIDDMLPAAWIKI